MFKSSTLVDSCRRYIFGIDDAVAVPALIKGGSEILGSIFGAGSSVQASRAALQGVRETNQTNLQIAKETNEQNYKIWQEEKQHNYDMWQSQSNQEWDMWNAENEYNSAAAQRERLEEAGYNPYLAIGGMSGNLATGMTNPSMNATHPPTMQAPTMQAPTRDMYASPLSIFGDTLNVVGDSVKTAKELESLQKDIDTKDYDLGFKRSIEGALRSSAEAAASEAKANADRARSLADIESLNFTERQILNKYVEPNAQVAFVSNLYNVWKQYQDYEIGKTELTRKTLDLLSSVMDNITTASALFTAFGGASATFEMFQEIGDYFDFDTGNIDSFTNYLNGTIKQLGRIPELLKDAIDASDSRLFDVNPSNSLAVPDGSGINYDNYSLPILQP